MRGGMFQLENFSTEFVNCVEKLVSINLCSNIVGQVAMSLVCNPPTEGEVGDLFIKERSDKLDSLKRRSMKLFECLDSLEGIHAQVPQGAM